MYVRLKHTLSALALTAIRRPVGDLHHDAAMCLADICRLISARSDSANRAAQQVPLAMLAMTEHQPGALARRAHRALEWLVQQGLLERHDDAVALPPGYQAHFPYMQRQVQRLAAVLRRLATTSMPRGKQGALRRGLALFNGGLFFECHEFFEDIWRAAPAEERDFYHGLILIAAAFYHYEKGNLHGARVKLSSGIHYLRPLPPASHGIRLDQWLARLEPWTTRIEEGLPGGVLKVTAIPKVPLVHARRRE